MPANDRGGLKSAFAGFKKTVDEEAELKLLGRTVEGGGTGQGSSAGVAAAVVETPSVAITSTVVPQSYQTATTPIPAAAAPPPAAARASGVTGGLIPRPLRQREAVRQLSFRCPVSLAGELRRKAAFNQLEQQEIIVEGIRRVLAELEEPPAGWSTDLS